MKITDLLLEQQGPSKTIINSILINSGLENSPSKDQIVNDITTKVLFNQKLRLQRHCIRYIDMRCLQDDISYFIL